MSEPQPPAAPASPWNTAPARPRTGPGCSKPLLVGCGILLAVLGLGAVVSIVKMPAIVQWWFEKLEAVLEPHMPPDATPAEVARYHAAFAAARRALASGTVDASRMKPFQDRLIAISGTEKKITRQQLHDFTVSLEQLAGSRPGAPGSPRAASGPSGSSPPR